MNRPQNTVPSLQERLSQAEEVLGTLAQVMSAVTDRLVEAERRVAVLEHAASSERLPVDGELVLRLASQVASLEQRTARGDSRSRAAEPDGSEDPEALVAVRAEHERVRLRTAILSSYEDRLQRLEARW